MTGKPKDDGSLDVILRRGGWCNGCDRQRSFKRDEDHVVVCTTCGTAWGFLPGPKKGKA